MPVPHPALAGISKERQRELMGAAVELYKSGAEPNDVAPKEHYTRAELRQAARAFGWKGTKSARSNPARAARRVATAREKVTKAVLVDSALTMAKDRVEHPIASRLRRS